MPIFNLYEITAEGIIVGSWKVTESLTDLQSKIELSHLDNKRLLSRKKTVNKKTFLASRILLLEMNVNLSYLYYKNGNIPCLSNGMNISISHTDLFVVVAISKNKKVGVDIEKYQSRIVNLSRKFLHPLDTKPIEKNSSIKLYTKIWSAKEAMFKAFEKPDVFFDKQMHVNLNNDHLNGKGTIFYKKESFDYKLFFSEVENHNLCISVSLK